MTQPKYQLTFLEFSAVASETFCQGRLILSMAKNDGTPWNLSIAFDRPKRPNRTKEHVRICYTPHSTFTFMFWPGLEVSCLQNGHSILGKLENGHCAEPSARSGAPIGCLELFLGWRYGGCHALARPCHGNCHRDSITTVAAHGRSSCCEVSDDTSRTPFAAKSFQLQSESA